MCLNEYGMGEKYRPEEEVRPCRYLHRLSADFGWCLRIQTAFGPGRFVSSTRSVKSLNCLACPTCVCSHLYRSVELILADRQLEPTEREFGVWQHKYRKAGALPRFAGLVA